jgi:outer membrane protein OmpA-like peptidoglycan-associated protein/tetratricopeptide (TPR) repeat protein
MTRSITLLFLLFVIHPSAFAQKNFVEKGDKLMRNFKFEKAAAMYKKAADKNANDVVAWQKLGNAFIMLGDNTSAEAIYQILTANSQSKPVDKFYYAQLLRNNGKYAEADAVYKNFAAALPADPRAAEFKNFADDVQPLTVDAKIFELSTLPENTAASEIGPVYNAGKLVFASNRAAAAGVKVVDTWSGRGYYDLYEQRSAGPNEVVVPGKMKGKVNKRLNDGPATFTRDGKEMFFTRSNYKEKDADGNRKLGLYHAEYNAAKNKWMNIQPLPFNSNAYNVVHPSVSKDGTKLYFASDMPGGLGETDIYMSRKNGSTWEQPVNLGKEINTPGQEVFPFIDDDGTLYFASDSRVGLGGLDIYMAPKAGAKGGTVQNLGTGINTRADDFGYVSDETGKYGFMVSDRTGGIGSDDIYKFTRIAVSVCGTVVDAQTGKTLGDAAIAITSAATSEEHKIRTNDKGDFCILLKPNENYKIQADKEGFARFENKLVLRTGSNTHQIINMQPKGGIDLVVDVSQKDAGALEGATVFLINKKTGEVVQQKSDSTGKVKFDLYKDQEYDLKVAKPLHGTPGVYDKFVKAISTMGFTPSQSVVNQSVQLNYYKDEAIFDLPNVYFDLNSNEIKPAAAKELDKLVKLMKAFPDVQVELSAHTDSRGRSSFNMMLSALRAKACVDYLETKGADITKLIAIGFGEAKIRNSCFDYVSCSETEHAVNRRIEFKVVRFD